ncbi:deoxyribodipyrimidine photo-lyase [Acinetobacter calcoaceticus]|uniref:Deoxyribodipyrimidine photo-lyase n=1 Tax=Acinetobacter calcoaceticus TaxID=471 RepID=A0A4R1XTY8_ACICA|nr:deoxyribodipyrimidine photo-lyase [Acinetobacter calcoaceticus]
MQLIWFRHDLRLHDHTALWHASQTERCVAVVILSPEQWIAHQDATIKIDFYLRQLHNLKQQLSALNIPLVILKIDLWRDIPAALDKLTQDLHIKTVHANIEFGLNESERDLQVQQLLQKNNKSLLLYHDRSLFPVGSILNLSQQPYKVFGAFKKAAYVQLHISLPKCMPDITAQAPLDPHPLWDTAIPTMAELNLESIPKQQQALWPVGETKALQRLDDFIAHDVAAYAQARDLPHLDQTSHLSAYLNIGILSIRQCLQALFRRQQGQLHIDNPGQQIWLDELLWREFYQHILCHFPRVSRHQPFKLQTQQIQWRDAPEDLSAWQHGRTGIPIVDAGMRQLLATGWMHNRVRMITAMFLSKNLLIDWRLGEQWFMQHLIDGDLAANNGGWQWCASTGVDSTPYFRIFNPITQSQRFDENGDYIRLWVPELAHLDAKRIHDPYLKQPDLELDYPRPIVDLKASRLRAIAAFKTAQS